MILHEVFVGRREFGRIRDDLFLESIHLRVHVLFVVDERLIIDVIEHRLASRLIRLGNFLWLLHRLEMNLCLARSLV